MIESLIYKTLIKVPSISNNMALYADKPAVFYQQIPHDIDKNWTNKGIYPNISYNVDWRYNPERKTDGSMEIDIYCNNESKAAPENLASEIVNNLSELFLTDESGTYCLLWDRSDSFDIEGKEPLVSGVTLLFDVLAFPKQESISPCPIWSVNTFIKENYSDCIMIGHDKVPESLRATSENPVVYVRKVNTKNIKTIYAMAWLEMDISISIISDNINNTRNWVSSIINKLSIEMETLMQTESPFLIMNINENTENDPLKTGQITISGQYGVMRKEKESIKLNNTNFRKE